MKKPIVPESKHPPGNRGYVVVDGMNIAYTTRYAYKQLTWRGESVAMYYGFIKVIQSIIKRHSWRPEKLIIVWDGARHPKRMEWCPEYKTHREIKRDLTKESEFAKQVKILRKFLYYMGIAQVHNKEVEGDDMIYWVVKKYSRLAKVTIISGDKDMLQLVNNDVQLYNQRQDTIYVPALIGAGNYGVGLENIVDFFCLIGDTADDIKGIKGIGEVRAAKFLSTYKSIDNYLKKEDAEFSGLIDKEHLAKVIKKNRRLIDLKWFNEKYWDESCITYYKDNQNPDFNEERYTKFCIKYGLKTHRLEPFINWLKTFQA